ncbi:MAG: phosphodiester glycosidase family protein [bacterium]|nr:phosphodiester glycosidase family protein [bacterium]
MFHRDDDVISFLEQTMELQIPKELLENKSKMIAYIEDNFKVEIPDSVQKKKKITNFLAKINQEFCNFLAQRRFLNRLKVWLFITILFVPLCFFFYFVSRHSDYVFFQQFHFAFLIGGFVFILVGIFLLTSIFRIQRTYQIRWRKMHTVLYSLLVIPILFFSAFIWMLYGSDSSYRTQFIQDVMNTKNYQYLANLFFNQDMIQQSLEHFIPFSYHGASSNQLYEFKPIEFEMNTYANSYEEEILKKDHPNDIYKIIKIQGTLRDGISKYSGYMTVVYEPSKVKIGTSIGAGVDDSSFGQILSQISKNYNALVAMNAGGFYDPNWDSNGGIPHGMVIQNGKLLTNFRRGLDSGGMIGFDENHRLVLRNVSAEEALDMKIRDAVDWGPYLIVDGVNYFKEESYQWACARTVIGQRKDGIVLLLVIDGDQPHSKGASYSDLADIMERYGAYNAANLDGGTSTSMVENHEYINIPFNGKKRTIRSLPNAWIVVE